MSTANKVNLPYNIANTAQLQAVYGAFHAQLIAAGLVQTGDTGQVDLTSITKTDAGTYGYQMFRLNDSLQGTVPFFIKLGFNAGQYSGGQTQTGLDVSFGTATDGAGNFTGTQSTDVYRWQSETTGTIGVTLNSYFSGDTNRFAMCYNDGPNLFNSAVWGFERTKNLDGSDSSDGLLFAFASNGGIAIGMLPATSDVGPFTSAQPYWPLAMNQLLPTMANGSKIGVAIPGYFNTYPLVPGLNFVCYLGTDFTAYAAQSLPMYDSLNHNYMCLTPTPGVSPSLPSGAHVMMRFE